MSHQITKALQLVSKDVVTLLSPTSIRDVSQTVGYQWRNRLLDPITTIHLFILQILNHNTASAHLPRITGRKFSVSANCQARARLPLVLLEKLLARISATVRPHSDAGSWRGHRTWLVDGTGVSMPDTAAPSRPTGGRSLARLRSPGCCG